MQMLHSYLTLISPGQDDGPGVSLVWSEAQLLVASGLLQRQPPPSFRFE